jgi:hypothetical protein
MTYKAKPWNDPSRHSRAYKVYLFGKPCLHISWRRLGKAATKVQHNERPKGRIERYVRRSIMAQHATDRGY